MGIQFYELGSFNDPGGSFSRAFKLTEAEPAEGRRAPYASCGVKTWYGEKLNDYFLFEVLYCFGFISFTVNEHTVSLELCNSNVDALSKQGRSVDQRGYPLYPRTIFYFMFGCNGYPL